MAHLRLSLLGPFRATLDGQPVTGFDSDKVRALLAYLVVESALPHRRETLAGLLWPDWPERAARRNLNQALANLRRVIGDRDATRPFLLSTHQDVQFDRGSDHWLDISALTEALDRCAAHCPEGDMPCDPCLERLAQAVRLYGGDFLQGFSLADSPEYEQWILVQREHAKRRVAYALARLAEGEEESGDYAEAARYALQWTELEPWEERAHRQLMRLYAWSGQRPAALRQYRECARILEEELGVSPSEETLQLYNRIAESRELPPHTDGLAEAATTRASAPKPNLPAQLIPLVGRSTELAEIVARLRDPRCRLLTLVGPGGSGKTRLAIEASRRVLDDADEGFADGVHFVSLAPLRSPDAMAVTVAQAIGLSGAQGTNSREQLLGYLRERRVLLVLDNLEHLLSPSAEGTARQGVEIPPGPVPPETGDGASLVAEVLRSAPEVKVLATSQLRLNVRGEQLYSVPGMDVPPPRFAPGAEPGDEAGYSAVQLFLESARGVRPGFEPAADDLAQIAEICRLAGGMPLAILLAAAWMRVLSPAEIAAEISGRLGRGLDLLATDWHGVPERQRSLRAVFDHTYHLLSEPQRDVFQALSVFRGSFAREAAREVGGASLRDLLALVDTSLLQRTATDRYELHELLRQYGAEKLAESPQRAEAARDRHAAYYAAAMERWAKEMQGPRQRAALTELEGGIADARAAWAWMVERGQVAWLDRALDGVFWLFEGLRRFDDAEAMYLAAKRGLAPAVDGAPTPAPQLRVLSRALAGLSLVLYWERGDHRRAQDLAERSLALLDRPELADQDVRRERAFASMIRALTGDDLSYSQAAELCEHGVDLYRALEERFWTAYALNRGGYTAGRYGEWEEARRLHEQSDAVYRELSLEVSRTWSLFFLSMTALHLGQFEEAERLARENLAIRQELSPEDASMGYVFLGYALNCLGRFAEARSAMEKGIAACHQLGLVRRRIEITTWWIAAGAHMGQYVEAEQQCRAHVQECRRLNAPVLTAWALGLLAWVDVATGSYDEAWRLAQEALALVPESPLPPSGEWLFAPSASGHAARGLGEPEREHSFFRQALRIAAGTKSALHVLRAVPGAALLLADQGQVERAVELYALCCRYSLVANSRWFEDTVGRHIAAAAAALPREVVAETQARGRSHDLWATIDELLAEFGP